MVAPGLALEDEAESALRYSEEDFYRRASSELAYRYERNEDFRLANTVVGGRRHYVAQQGDTFLDVARFYGLGYNEIEEANEGVDPWLPERAAAILLPTEWVLPEVQTGGLVVNIPEMRLYYFVGDPRSGQRVMTYPVGLGRNDWRTPKGLFKVVGKTKNPQWVIPESIREERIREKGLHDRAIPGGDPRNPLGKYRLELTMPGYRIHGTNKSYGVGMQVSHGCVRLYPEDIERLFSRVSVGSPGEFTYQPVKLGARDGRIYIEVHPDIYTMIPGLHGEAKRLVRTRGWSDFVDERKLAAAVEAQTGVPTDVTAGAVRDSDPPDEDQPGKTDHLQRTL
jgi:L,D-transpeptidase ErfK/SrfK